MNAIELSPACRSQALSYEQIRKIFFENLTALDLAEPLPVFDEHTSCGVVKTFMAEKGVSVVGVPSEGFVDRYVTFDALEGRDKLKECARSIDPAVLVAGKAPLSEVVTRLADSPSIFVSALGAVIGTVSRKELEKPAARMWLFGVITLIETNLVTAVDLLHPDEGWKAMVPSARLETAMALCRERRRRGESCREVECLQLVDKLELFLKHQAFRRNLNIQGGRQAKQLIKRLESLRNNLAHSQAISAENWEGVMLLSSNIDNFIGTQGVLALTGTTGEPLSWKWPGKRNKNPNAAARNDSGKGKTGRSQGDELGKKRV